MSPSYPAPSIWETKHLGEGARFIACCCRIPVFYKCFLFYSPVKTVKGSLM